MSSGAIFDFDAIRQRLKELGIEPVVPVKKDPEPEQKPADDTEWYGGEYCG